ncbi:MAG: MerR family transcriptional regulator [Eubacteriaceae bacterium]
MGQKKYTISEASEILNYEAHVLRYYEEEFNIKVPRNNVNHREYSIKEIEIFQYIKQLKDQGYNNNQIKEILKSPTVSVPNTFSTNNDSMTDIQQVNSNDVAINIEQVSSVIISGFSEINESIRQLTDSLEEVKSQFDNDEKDVLVAENAKLKMRLKEKAYELVDIKEKYSKLEKKKFIFKKLFK